MYFKLNLHFSLLPILFHFKLVLIFFPAAPYKEFDPYPFTANSTTCGSVAENANCLASLHTQLSLSFISNRLVTNRTALFAYAEDYGHI